MSKSADSDKNYIGLLDEPETVQSKIKTAITDSGGEIIFDEKNKPALSNLITIYSLATGESIKQTEAEFKGKGYGEFKAALANALVEFLKPLQQAYYSITDEEAKTVLKDGANRAQKVAAETLDKAKEKIGLLQS